VTLDRDRIVRQALKLLDEVGLEGLSLRTLAARLKVQAPAIYWHFENKQALLDEMATRVFAAGMSETAPPANVETWQEWAAYYGNRLRRMLLSHRDGARMMSGTFLTDNSLYEPMEQALKRFTDAGFSLQDAVVALSTIYSYAIGFVIEEQAVYPQRGKRNPQYDVAKRAQRIDADTLPLARAAGETLFTHYDERFEKGLQLIIRGMQPGA
jgi:TetR/AcrR family transcriptional regulator, tetracycline repressor protein